MTLTAAEVERIFREAGALLEGHFILASGKHSARYLEKFRVFERPRFTERLCAGIVERQSAPVDAVAGPTTGGILLAHEVARQLGTRALYAEREAGSTGRVFRRGQTLARGERVLVVDDILSTGGSLGDTIALLRAHGATPVAAAVLVDRSGGADLGVPLQALWTTTSEAYAPDSCPLCARGLPAVKPGTTPAAIGSDRERGGTVRA